MAVFNDALDLRTAVAEHVGNRAISDVWPRLVGQAESWLNRKLRTQWQIDEFTPAYVDNVAPLPADFLQLVDSNNYLRVVTPNLYRRAYYTSPDAVRYYAALPTISASLSASNWLLEQFPDVYLYAVGLEAAKFLKDVELSAVTDALLSSAMTSLKVDDDRARWSNVSVRVGGCTP